MFGSNRKPSWAKVKESARTRAALRASERDRITIDNMYSLLEETALSDKPVFFGCYYGKPIYMINKETYEKIKDL